MPPLAKLLLDNGVVSERSSLVIDLVIASLINQLSGSLQVRYTPWNVWLSNVQRGLVQSDKHTVVNLSQSEQLQHLSWTCVDAIDTSDPNDKCQFGLSLDIEVPPLLSLA